MGLIEQKQLDEAYVMPTFARKQVCFVEGEGMRLRDDAGKEYLDFLSGIGVCCLGHCHPKVVGAIEAQAKRLIHVSNYYYIEHRGEVAAMLSNMLNGWRGEDASGAWQAFFANSGAEANECAMKLARVWSKRFSHGGNIIITLEGSFHGRTMETIAATAQSVKQELFTPLPEGFIHVPLNDIDALQAANDKAYGQEPLGDEVEVWFISDKQENAIWSEARIKPFEKDRPYTLHLEFMLSFMPNATGQARSNSGVYLQEEYECQVLDSFGLEGENNECAGFYQQLKPIVNACFPPLTWQTYDFDVTPAKFNDKGEKIANAVITVKHNGILVHDKAELAHETPGGKTEKTEAGEARGVFLQGHGNKVQYRNIWIKYND